MNQFLALLAFCVFLTKAEAQIIIRTVTENRFEDLQYPNQSIRTSSSQPVKGTITLNDGTVLQGVLVCYKRKDRFEKVKVTYGDTKKEVPASAIRSIKLDPTIEEQKYSNNYKNPERNFQPGYAVLPDGVKLKGSIAQDRTAGDYDFFIYGIFFLPERSNVASFIRGGALQEFGQEINGRMIIWDGYADGYLKRLVDGRYRLTRNPYSSARLEWFTSLKNPTADSLSKQVASEAFSQNIKSSKDINSAIETSVSAADFVEALGNIDITRKEFLLFDVKTRTVQTVNKENFKTTCEQLVRDCQDKLPHEPAERDRLMDWDQIEEFVHFLNTDCRP